MDGLRGVRFRWRFIMRIFRGRWSRCQFVSPTRSGYVGFMGIVRSQRCVYIVG